VSLEDWDSGKSYDRLVLTRECTVFWNIELPHLLLPVRPGRIFPIIVETGALNQRLKKMGVFSAREFDQKLQEWMKMESQKRNV
jgi:HPr kinase/phosphorylase